MKGFRFFKRAFLNKPGHFTSAHILATITDEAGRAADVTLHIADCDRKIKLTLPLYSADDRRNSLAKIRALVETLDAFEDELLEVAAEAAAQQRSRK